MKYKKVDLDKMAEAVYEFENSTQPNEQVCDKFGVEKTSFYYHLRKYRTKKQQGGNVHIPVNSCANSSSLHDNRAFLSRSPEACVMQASQTSPEIDKDRNMLVSLNTNSRKMREYIKQHDTGS